MNVVLSSSLLLFVFCQSSSSSEIVQAEADVNGDTSIERSRDHSTSIELPDVFAVRSGHSIVHCENNAIVNGWCDHKMIPELECGLLPEFNEYGCQCMGDPSLCPTECIDSSIEPVQKTRYGIRCSNIPMDQPNYIMKEKHHVLHTCENNAIVSAWCDDYVNVHLSCGLYIQDDQYLCKCTGKATNCPTECIHGIEPIVRTPNSVLCAGIPNDNPNYVLKDARK